MASNFAEPLNDESRQPENEAGMPRLRWFICALLFLATAINYTDRAVIGVLKPTLRKELGWNEIDFSNVIFWFQVAYAAGYLFGGRFMDWIGVRLGYALAVIFWSAAAMAHALARTVFGFSVARFGLGLAEGGNFPAAIKTVSEWFPIKERALATGILNAGSSVGAIATPLLVPWITLWLGWRAVFILTAPLGFAWAVAWLLLYRKPDQHPRLTKQELAHIRGDAAESSQEQPLGAGFPVQAIRAGSDDDGPAAGGDLRNVGSGQHRRGMAVVTLHPRGMEYQCRAKDGHADLRAVRASGFFRGQGVWIMDGRSADRPRRRRASGLGGELVYIGFRHDAASGRQFRRRHRRNGRLDSGDVLREIRWVCLGKRRQLSVALCHGIVRLSDRAGGDPGDSTAR